MTAPNFLLLDTHIWVWFVESDASQMSHKAIEFVKRASERAEVLVSDISFWEVANKSAKGKLSLSIETVLWLKRAGDGPGATYLPVERLALIQSTRLVGTPPRDPADRILIATAQLNNATLVTTDKQIIEYARDTRTVSTYDAR